MLGCDQCQIVTINGIPCHETGCPNSHINPATGNCYQKDCYICGCEFTPRDKDDTVCTDCEEMF